MPLTSELDRPDSPARKFLEEKFPNTRRVVRDANTVLRQAETIRPAAPLPWGTLGTAFDYRARYYFRATPFQDLTAWQGAQEISGTDLGWEDTDQSVAWYADKMGIHMDSLGSLSVLRRFQGRTQRYIGPNPERMLFSRPSQRDSLIPSEIIMDFFASLEDVLARIRPEGRLLELNDEELLARYCVVLALFEEMTRPGAAQARLSSPLVRESDWTVKTLLQIVQTHWVDDLYRLSRAFFFVFQDRLLDKVILNPIFQGSGDVGGADGDIIVDNCLVDFKVTVKAAIGKLEIYQLLGYLLLDYDDEYEIERVGFYMARQGEFIKWPVTDLLNRLMGSAALSPLQDLRREFRDCLT